MTTQALFWNKIAAKYAARPVAQPEVFDRKIAATKACMSAEQRVLDVGCGTGSLVLRLADTGAEVHGLDVSAAMIDIAKQKLAATRYPKVHFHVGALEEAARLFEAESLDGVCVYSLLHLVEDRLAALRLLYGLLKPGAFLVDSTVCLGESKLPFMPLIALMRCFGKAPAVKSVTKAVLETELREAGFATIDYPDVGAKPIISFLIARKPSA